jgi:23S rRNA (cytosine1962-C5)-methyltransferase
MTIGQSIIQCSTEIPTLVLQRDISKHLKRGHRWAFANAFDDKVKIKSGLSFLRYKDELLGLGICQNETQLRFRMLCLADEFFFKKNNPQKTLEIWADHQWKLALQLREAIDLSVTNSFRLINGEGDGLPGLVVDIYGNTAVVKYDNPLMEKIWNKAEIANKIITQFQKIECVYLKRRNNDDVKGENLIGTLAEETLFKENGMLFASNIRDAAKTGFFLDQRDNRYYLKNFSKNKSVLNLFSYTGGFSVFAAVGGASSITSVDIAKVAIAAVKRNFEINHLKVKTQDIATDAFDYVEQEIKAKTKFDMVITDPPSFAPNEKSVPQATAAYIKIFSDSLRLVNANGFFAASSCSSHISTPAFFDIIKEAFSKARMRGTLVHIGAQPFDHPYPLAMEELRYLKFALFRVD